MTYSISQMAARFGLEPHTLRFYEKEGILAPRRSPGGVRQYSEEDAGRLEMVLCLKSTGMSLRDIKQYFDLVELGDATLAQRLEIFLRHREHVQEEIAALQNNLKILDRKIQWCRSELENTAK